jgi:hypothetical protein
MVLMWYGSSFSFFLSLGSGFSWCSLLWAGLLVLAPLALASPELGGTRIGSLCSPTEMRRGTAKFDWEG